MKKFPKTIYVTRDMDTEEQYLTIPEDDGGIPEVVENTPVALYELKGVADLVVSRTVQWKGKK